MNSAQSLQEILSRVHSAKSQDGELFATVLARELGLSGDGAEFAASAQLARLVRRVEADLEALSLDNDAKKLMRQHLAPFVGLRNVNAYQVNMKSFKTSTHSADKVLALVNVHAAFSGKLEFTDFSNECKELVGDIDKLREKLSKSNLSEDFRKQVDVYLNRLSAAVSHYRFSGERGLDEALSILMGHFAIHVSKEEREKHKGLVTAFSNLCKKGLRILKVARAASGDVIAIAENFSELLENFNDEEEH